MEVEEEFNCKLKSDNQNNDCVKCFDNYFQYEKDVAEGIIIQTFYILNQESRLNEKDNIITQMAEEFFGKPTGENGLWNGIRRDIDFKFKNSDLGKEFKKKVINYGFHCHQQMNKNGILVEMPSVSTIQSLIQKAAQIHC